MLRNIITTSVLVVGLISPVASSASGIEWCHAWADTQKKMGFGKCRPTKKECLRTVVKSNKSTICHPFAK